MSLEDDLTAALIEGYQQAGKEVGYWGRRFLQAVRRNGGVTTAKKMMTPRNSGQRKGLDALLEAGRPDLTLEAIILQPKFLSLFTKEELLIAAERLGEYGRLIEKHRTSRKHLFPDELEPGHKYAEGARKKIRVNSYERDSRARKDCLKKYGFECIVCAFKFEDKYGDIGKEFIHVHHLKPLALLDGEYQLDPILDLRPVCPNCHAMLHTSNPPLTIEKLKEMIDKKGI